MCNKQEEEEFFLFPFFSSFVDIGRRSNAKLLIVLIGYISLSLFCCCLPRKERNQWQWHIDAKRKREVPIYNSRINDEKEKRKHPTPPPSTQKRKTDRCLAGASDSFSLFFSSVRSLLCYCCTTFWRVSFFFFFFFFFSLSAVVFRLVSLSLSVAYVRDYYPFRWFSRLFFLKI